MGNKTDLDARVKIDNASAALTDITAYMTSAALRGVQDILDDSAFSTQERTYLAGKAGATVPLAGFVNTTTRGIFAPLVGNRTSITKTVEYRLYATNSTGSVGAFLNGEAWITNVEFSGSLNSIQTWSCDATFTGAVNSTSAQLT